MDILIHIIRSKSRENAGQIFVKDMNYTQQDI